MKIKIKTATTLILTTLLFLTALPQRLEAQIPVTDVANLAQNTAIFLKNAAMLKIMIDNFQKGKGDSEQILPFLKELEEVLKQGEALAYSDGNIAGAFEDKFPGYKISDGLWSEKSEMWTETQLDTLRNVLESVHKQNENFTDEQHLVGGILEQSNGAIGEMQALQQGNALVAATVKQLAKMRQLMMSQINADTVYRAAEVSRRAESEAKGVAWASAAPRTLEPMSANDPRGIGDLNIIRPKHR